MAYCTNQQVKDYLGIGGSGDDVLLTTLITRAQAIIDEHVDRTFEATGDTTRNFDSMTDVDGMTLYLDEDLSSITTVTNGDGTSVASTKYVTEPRNKTPYYALTLLPSSDIAWEAETDGDTHDAIAIAGRWAYSTTAPADIVHACVVLASWLYRRKDSVGSETDRPIVTSDGVTILPSAMPAEVKQILHRYKKYARF